MLNGVATKRLVGLAVARWGRHSRRIAVAHRRGQRKLGVRMGRLRLLAPAWLAWKLYKDHWEERKRTIDGPRTAALHCQRRQLVTAWAGWKIFTFASRLEQPQFGVSSSATPGSVKRKRMMSVIAEESFMTVASNLSANVSGATVWNTPLPEQRGDGHLEEGDDSPELVPPEGFEGVARRGFAAAATSPKYETGVATSLHLQYTAAGRREHLAATHWFGRLAPRAWGSWMGAVKLAKARERRADRHCKVRVLAPVWKALGESILM